MTLLIKKQLPSDVKDEIQVFLKPQVNTLKNEDHFVFCSAFSIDFKQCRQTRRGPKVNFEKCNQRQD